MAKKNELDDLLSGSLQQEASTPRPALSASTPRRENQSSESGRTIWADVDILHDNPFQPSGRMALDELQNLLDGFDAEGQVHDAIARAHPTRPGQFQLADGHRRKEIVKKHGANAGIKQAVPQQFIGKLRISVRELTDEQMLSYILESNVNLLKNSPLQNAQIYAAMRAMTTAALIEKGLPPLGDPDANGQPQASWRQVCAHYNYAENRHVDLARVALILELPDGIQKEFEDDPDDSEKMVLNSLHARALSKFHSKPQAPPEQIEADKKRMKSLLGQIKKEKLAGSQAIKRAADIKKIQPTSLELEMEAASAAAIKKIQDTEAAASRAAAHIENARALRRGYSHLSIVPGGDASTPAPAPPVAAATPPAPSTPEAGITTARQEAPPSAVPVSQPKPTSQTTAFSGAPLNHWSAAAEYLARALREMGECKAADLEVARNSVRKIRALNDEVDARLYQLDKEIDDFEAYLNFEPSREKAVKKK